MVLSAAFVYWQKKNHGTGSIGWVLWWSRQWIKRLRRKLFISCFMKISAVIQTSVFLEAYQNDESKSSFFSYMKHLLRQNDTYTRLTCSKLNNYYWNVYYCLQAHQRFMQMHTFTWNAKQFFFPSNNYKFAFAFTYTMQNCSCRWW